MSGEAGLPPEACFCVVLAPRLGFALLRSCPREQLRLEHKLYRDWAGHDFIGFYDWLRDASGRVIGVRETFGVGLEALLDLIPNRGYLLKVLEPPRVEVFFGRSRDYAPADSSDQTTLQNRMLVASDGEVVLTFGVNSTLERRLQHSIARPWLPAAEVDGARE